MNFAKNRYRFRRALGCALALAALAGCGGSAASGRDGSTSASYGLVATRSLGSAQPPVVATGQNATVYGLAGASFTQVEVTATETGLIAPIVNRLAIIDDNGELALVNQDWTQLVVLTPGYRLAANPQISADGRKIVYDAGDDLHVIDADGSNDHLLIANASEGSWSPDGRKLVFKRTLNGFDHLYTMDADGLNLTQITHGTLDEDWPVWSPDGSRIAYRQSPLLCTCKPDGSSVIPLINGSYPTWTPDGQYVVFFGQNRIAEISGTGGVATGLSGGASTYKYRPSCSPDGQTLYVTDFYSGQPIVYGLDLPLRRTAGSRSATAYGLQQPCFSPATSSTPVLSPTTTYIGTGGTLGPSCAGFLFGQIDRSLTAFATFDTVDTTAAGRSLARVVAAAPSAPDLASLVFTVSTAGGSPLGSFQYVNGLGTPNVVLPSTGLPSATGVVVTFDAIDGGVTAAAPYVAAKSPGGNPTVVRNGSTLQISAHFLGVWDKNGRNVAPGGASNVRIDASTGALESFD